MQQTQNMAMPYASSYSPKRWYLFFQVILDALSVKRKHYTCSKFYAQYTSEHEDEIVFDNREKRKKTLRKIQHCSTICKDKGTSEVRAQQASSTAGLLLLSIKENTLTFDCFMTVLVIYLFVFNIFHISMLGNIFEIWKQIVTIRVYVI